MVATFLRPEAVCSSSMRDVFLICLRLRLTNFGEPIAHLGCFLTELVERRQSLEEEHYPDIVALCQLLAGLTSCRVEIILTLLRADMFAANVRAATIGR